MSLFKKIFPKLSSTNNQQSNQSNQSSAQQSISKISLFSKRPKTTLPPLKQQPNPNATSAVDMLMLNNSRPRNLAATTTNRNSNLNPSSFASLDRHNGKALGARLFGQQHQNKMKLFPDVKEIGFAKNNIEINEENVGEKKRLRSRMQMLSIVEKDSGQFWQLLNEIGDGAFGKVYKAKNRFSEQLAAAKHFEKCTEEEIDDCLIEVEILKECKHPNIVKIYDAFYYEKKLLVMI